MPRIQSEVIAVANAREARQRLTAGERFDVVLCDLMMPDITGIEFYEELCRSVPDVAAKIVFMTGGAFTSAARDFLERVPNPCLEKPFHAEDFRVVVEQFLS